ncbi:MAG: type II toxin-antitoxin system HicB family antitoxin [Candidatus Kapaibacteriota bacterium]|jgi:predicted RNase H-like HicB family nuclease
MKYPIILEDSGDGWILARCPIVRGCYAQGETRTEALVNIREVLQLTLELRQELGLPLTENEFSFVEATEVEL